MDGLPTVWVHIASWNSRASTELTIRTAQRFAQHPFELIVGDGGSTDGSVEMLRDFAGQGVLRLERVTGGRSHGDWIDRWITRCTAQYAVYVDSDIEFLRPGWLAELVAAARHTRADLVYAEAMAGDRAFTDLRTGELVELAPRPAPWLFLMDVRRAWGVNAGFDEISFTPGGGGRRRVHDVGGWFFIEARRHGLTHHMMARSYRRHYRHFGGASWMADARHRAPWVQSTRERVEARLAVELARTTGRSWTARWLAARSSGRHRLSRMSELTAKATSPSAVRRRLSHGRERVPWEDGGPAAPSSPVRFSVAAGRAPGGATIRPFGTDESGGIGRG